MGSPIKQFIHDILYSKENKQYSSSKFWFTICNAAVVTVYVMYALSVVSTVPVPVDIDGLLWMTTIVIGALTGNKLGDLVIKKKYGGTQDVLDQGNPPADK